MHGRSRLCVSRFIALPSVQGRSSKCSRRKRAGNGGNVRASKPRRKNGAVTTCARLSARTRARWVHRCDAMRCVSARHAEAFRERRAITSRARQRRPRGFLASAREDKGEARGSPYGLNRTKLFVITLRGHCS